MQGRLLDGKTTRSIVVTVTFTGGRVQARGEGADALIDWPARRVHSDALADGEVRLSVPGEDARLIVPGQAWNAALGDEGAGIVRRSRGRELGLVMGLAVAGLTLAAVVFIGIPAASGPLARRTPPEMEARFGRMMELQLLTAFKPCSGRPAGEAALQGLGDRLASGAKLAFPIKVRAVRAPFVNAFALPGGLILVTDDMIAKARGPDELAGVLAHEIAHVEKRHVMQSAWRSMGMGLILDAAVGGGSGAGQQGVILAGSVWEMRFSRELEREADKRAVELLTAQNVSPQGLSSFFERMAKEDKINPRLAGVEEWLSSHPNSLERAKLIPRTVGAPAMAEADWQTLKSVCSARPARTGWRLTSKPASAAP